VFGRFSKNVPAKGTKKRHAGARGKIKRLGGCRPTIRNETTGKPGEKEKSLEVKKKRSLF